MALFALSLNGDVSTHSRLKAAGYAFDAQGGVNHSFNTQPPEGGWFAASRQDQDERCFNTQPPEGGWLGK